MGGQTERIDYTSNDYGIQTLPDYHSNQYKYSYEYGAEYSSKGKETRTNL